MMARNQCAHTWKNGRRCKLTAKSGTFCHNHDPARKEARRKIGKRSRNKGSTFERQVASDFRPVFPGAKRAGLRQTQSGAHDAPDVSGCEPFWIETKHGKKTNPRAALAQAENALRQHTNNLPDASKPIYEWPVAVCKDDRKTPFVVMELSDFLELLAVWRAPQRP